MAMTNFSDAEVNSADPYDTDVDYRSILHC